MSAVRPILRVLRTGAALSYQDAGRHVWRKYGVAPCGFIDPTAARLTNRLVGNLPDDTVIECAMAGASFAVLDDCYLAVGGASPANGLPAYSARHFTAGERFTLRGSSDGCWSYLATPGGWQISESSADDSTTTPFGSASYHAHSALGPSLSVGDDLYAAAAAAQPDHARFIRHADRPDLSRRDPLTLTLGPDHRLFHKDRLERLCTHGWEVSPLSDRSGYRLVSPKAGLGHTHSIPSAPVVVGALQLTPAGELIIALNDGPTVGGYPVIAVLAERCIPSLVQRLPGQQITFTFEK